jgi:hypothetical protein
LEASISIKPADVASVTISRMMKWMGHVARMKEIKEAYKTL